MAKRLLKRTAPGAPKPLPQRGKEIEEETTTCAAPVNVATKSEYMLGKCVKCNRFPSNSESDHLCHNCHQDAAGLTFDGKRWVKKTKKGSK